jgi:hypothetical protein
MGQPAERLRDNGNKNNKWKQETEEHRETADHLLLINTRSTRQPRIGHGHTSRQIHHYLFKQKLQGNIKEEMGKEDSIMEDHSKHPCKQQRMEQEPMKNRIKQTTTAFLTTIIVTLIILNTGSRNKAPQHGQCAQKQDNRDKKEDSRGLGNKGYRTGRTPQTSINNQHTQSKARHDLDRTINRYTELITRTDSRPNLHKDYTKEKLMTAIAIGIMIIATAYAAATDIGTTTYKTYNMEHNSARKTRSTGSKRQQQTNHKTRHKKRTQHRQNREQGQ